MNWGRWRPLAAGGRGRPTEQPYNPALEPAPLGDVIQRGTAAHRLLNDPTLAEAIEEIRRESLSEIVHTKPEEREEREAHYRDLRALERMVSKLIAYRASAQIREAQRASELSAADAANR